MHQTARFFISAATLVTIGSCSGGEAPFKPDTRAAAQEKFVDMPEVCGIKPLSQAKYDEYQKDPIFKEISQAFVAQVKKLASNPSVFGEKFVEYPADPKAGYSRLYIAEENPNDLDPVADSPYGDYVEREVIPVKHLNFDKEVDPFSKLYTLKPTPDLPSDPMGEDMSEGQGIREPELWQPAKAKRVSGFFFAGYKIPPDAFKQRCGFWSDLFNFDRKRPLLRRFESLYAASHICSFEAIPRVSVPEHISNTINSLFLSTSRSVFVARRFAVGSGARRKAAPEAYVYVIMVHNGFDTRDPNVKPHFTGLEREQEVAVGGMIEWSDIVGYRKMLSEPKPGAPPEFVGPIYLREKFKELEPEAFAKVVNTLSMKSRFTQDFENGRPWRGKRDPKIPKLVAP